VTLRGRLVLAAAGAVAASIALVALVVFYAERRESRLLVDSDLHRQATAVAEELLVSGEVDDALRQGPLGAVSHAQVVSPDGEVLPLVPSASPLPVTDEVLEVAASTRDRFYATPRSTACGCAPSPSPSAAARCRSPGPSSRSCSTCGISRGSWRWSPSAAWAWPCCSAGWSPRRRCSR
jgi:hypothetical protein